MRQSVIALGLGLALGSAGPGASARDLYDWLALAPVVAVGESLGENGKYTEVRVERVLRGAPIAQDVIRVDVRLANRDRNRDTDPHALHLDESAAYVLLLEPTGMRKGFPTFELVRGIHGARELPAEGREAYIDALSRCLAIQGGSDDHAVWIGLEGLLQDQNPLLLRMALGQFLKFRRGDAAVLASLRPLLDHPDGDVREAAARLAGQIARFVGPDGLPEPEALRADLVGLSRRDPFPAVRTAAVEALNHLGGAEALGVLEQIADDDPDQNVRFMAERLLFEHRGGPD